MTKLRMKEYEENPNMELSGKEMQIVMSVDQVCQNTYSVIVMNVKQVG